MNKPLRKLRGVMGIGLTWGILLAALTVVLVTVIGVINPDGGDGVGPLVAGAIFGMVGLISGIGFGILLSFAERGKTMLDVSLSRAAIWGILASAAFPLLTGGEDQVFLTCTLGAAIAPALVAIARRAMLHSGIAPRRADSEQPKRLLDVIFGYVLTLVRDAVNPPKELSV